MMEGGGGGGGYFPRIPLPNLLNGKPFQHCSKVQNNKQLKGWMHNRLMSNVGPFFFFFGFVSIFACGLRFSQQTLPCIFFRWFALRF